MALQSIQPERTIHIPALIETTLLGGMATLMIAKWLRGQLDFYIHPRYTALMLVTAVILLLMASVRVRAVLSDAKQARPGGIYLLLAVPLLFGVLVPARPLGADTLAGRGVELASIAPQPNATLPFASTPDSWNLLEWSTALSVRGEELDGEPADVIGFVYQDQTLGADKFYVVRYVITCCAADGAGVGLPVAWPAGKTLADDTWVRVQGIVNVTTSTDAVLQASTVEPIEQPENPYLYP